MNHALFRVLLPRPLNIHDCALAVSAVRFVKSMLQYTVVFVLVVHVLFELPVKSTLPIRGIFCVIVTVPAVVNVAVSCGSGTRDDHVAVDHVAHDTQFVVTGVVNVIPEFPPQSPEFHVIAERFQLHAPVPVMSWKSALVTVTVAAVRVLAVPRVLDFIKILAVVDVFPFMVSVQFIVWLAAK